MVWSSRFQLWNKIYKRQIGSSTLSIQIVIILRKWKSRFLLMFSIKHIILFFKKLPAIVGRIILLAILHAIWGQNYNTTFVFRRVRKKV